MIASRVSLNNEEGRPFHFQYQNGKGFGLVCGQILLSLITVGFYAPWALAKVGRWFLSNTYIEPS